MILAMISRVSLGHTGRPLLVGRPMVIAFLVMFSALLVRVLAPFGAANYDAVILLTAILWATAYGVFLVVYLPVLSRPRFDGSPG
jgi:uncharacterized protein involved in response to NO